MPLLESSSLPTISFFDLAKFFSIALSTVENFECFPVVASLAVGGGLTELLLRVAVLESRVGVVESGVGVVEGGLGVTKVSVGQVALPPTVAPAEHLQGRHTLHFLYGMFKYIPKSTLSHIQHTRKHDNYHCPSHLKS